MYCVGVLSPAHLSLCPMCAVPEKARKRGGGAEENIGSPRTGASVWWMLGNEPGSEGRAASVLRHRNISPTRVLSADECTSCVRQGPGRRSEEGLWKSNVSFQRVYRGDKTAAASRGAGVFTPLSPLARPRIHCARVCWGRG